MCVALLCDLHKLAKPRDKNGRLFGKPGTVEKTNSQTRVLGDLSIDMSMIRGRENNKCSGAGPHYVKKPDMCF